MNVATKQETRVFDPAQHRIPYVFRGTVEEGRAHLETLRGIMVKGKLRSDLDAGAKFPKEASLYVTLPTKDFEAWINPHEVDLPKLCRALARSNGVWFRKNGATGKASMYGRLPVVQVIPDSERPEGVEGSTDLGVMADAGRSDEDMAEALNQIINGESQ